MRSNCSPVLVPSARPWRALFMPQGMTRVDYPAHSQRGFVVRFRQNGHAFHRYFGDRRYGSSVDAYLTALAWASTKRRLAQSRRAV